MTAQEVSGYVSGMPSLMVQRPEGGAWWQALLHNRLNFGWQPSDYFRVDVGMRNRLILGSEILINPQSIGYDTGWLDLSWNWATWKNGTGNTSFDRLCLTFEVDRWKMQLGRQRINWGQTFVWNPHDLFNTYSFFDFDYVERPGCDALRVTYYPGETSSVEWAVSVNHQHKTTAAVRYRWNKKGVDYQIVVGEQAQTDFVVGGALTFDVKGLNIRSELSCFQPIKNLLDTCGTVAVSIGADYIFANSLRLQTEVLYNNVSKSLLNSGLMGLYAAPLSAKYLSICPWNLFAQCTYPLTPRLNGSLSGIYFIDMPALYSGLSLDYSVAENLDLSLIAQYLATFATSTLEKLHLYLGFARMKYSF